VSFVFNLFLSAGLMVLSTKFIWCQWCDHSFPIWKHCWWIIQNTLIQLNLLRHLIFAKKQENWDCWRYLNSCSRLQEKPVPVVRWTVAGHAVSTTKYRRAHSRGVRDECRNQGQTAAHQAKSVRSVGAYVLSP
jgi:hypothetical protein